MVSAPTRVHRFEFTVLGCSGGPIDGGTCAYLLKPSCISYDEIVANHSRNKFICIDGGTGISGLVRLIKVDTDKENVTNLLLDMYSDSLPLAQYTNCPTSLAFKLDNVESPSPYKSAAQIFELLDKYLITHAHADHFFGLVLNSPAFLLTKTIIGTSSTVQTFQNHVFNNYVWPNLNTVNYQILNPPNENWYQLTEDFQVQCLTNNHGSFMEGTTKIPYESNAYLIKNMDSNLLVFGDVELDSISHSNKNRIIWEHIAPLVSQDQLLAIVIECSNFDVPSNVPLYGHMTTKFLIQEFVTLKDILMDKYGSEKGLKGLNIIITHIKESTSGSDPRKRILRELHDFNLTYQLGLIFTIALPGLTYCL